MPARDACSSRPSSSARFACSSGSRSRWPSASRSGSDATLLQRNVDMGRPDVDGLNTGYAALLLEQYLDNPGAVPEEWRDLFESKPEVLLQRHPGLARLPGAAAADAEGHATRVATPPPASAPAPAPAPAVAEEDKELLGGIAASM